MDYSHLQILINNLSTSCSAKHDLKAIKENLRAINKVADDSIFPNHKNFIIKLSKSNKFRSINSLSKLELIEKIRDLTMQTKNTNQTVSEDEIRNPLIKVHLED